MCVLVLVFEHLGGGGLGAGGVCRSVVVIVCISVCVLCG